MVCLAEEHLNALSRIRRVALCCRCLLATPAGAAPTLPVAMAMAAGGANCFNCDPYARRASGRSAYALMVPTRSPRALVQRIMDLREDPALQARLTDTGRAEAYEHFSMTRMLDAYRRVLSNLK